MITKRTILDTDKLLKDGAGVAFCITWVNDMIFMCTKYWNQLKNYTGVPDDTQENKVSMMRYKNRATRW